MPISLAKMGGARSPMITKYAMHVPILRAMILGEGGRGERKMLSNIYTDIAFPVLT